MGVTDLELCVHIPKKKDAVQVVNYDSQFMIEIVHEIGCSICKAYPFLLHSKPIFLFMENAGGHGKKNIKEQYVKILKDVYNIKEWKVPNSPEIDILHFGT